MAEKSSTKKSGALSTGFIVGIILLGIGLLLYPFVSNYINERTQSKAIASYTEEVERMSTEDYEKMWADAHAYNEALRQNSERFVMERFDEELYASLLNVSGTGIMGYIEIPKLDVFLPIYHGTGEDSLQVAVGHIKGTSLPVGGPGTHAAISGHSGLTSAKLFTNLEDLENGDEFYLNILNEKLTYEVGQIEVVLPEDMSLLAIDDTRDYCTLVTCTPYGVNSHRLLVRGERIH